MGGDDQSLVCSVNQNEQLFTSGAEQENESSDGAQNVEDKSSRNEELQSKSNAMQRKEERGALACADKFPLKSRIPELYLLNSKVKEFENKTYNSSYNIVSGRTKFKVEYKPSTRKLNIVMPVKFMGPTHLNPLDSDIKRPNTMSANIPKHFKRSYKNSVQRMWSDQCKLYLNANDSATNGLWNNEYKPYLKTPVTNGVCYNWSVVSPVEVKVSVQESSDESESYKIYYNRDINYRDVTTSDYVIFSRRTYIDRKADIKNNGKQNVFAHEFGHQIGLADEYAVDYTDGEYSFSMLDAYDRSARCVKHHPLERHARDRTQLSHNGENYWVKKNGSKYYLVYANSTYENDNNKRGEWLDGTYTRNTQWAAEEFGVDYANENATTYDEYENDLGLEENLMNGGNVFKPHYYIPFKRGMVEAIQKNYGNSPRTDAPNMDKDWKIG